MKTLKIFGRDPALLLGLLSTFLQMFVAYGMHLTNTETAAINGIAAAILGLVTAFVVARDQLAPAILGVAQGGFTLFLAFGAHLSQNQVATGMAVAAAIVAAFVRTQVTAPISATGEKVPRKSPFRLAA